MPSNRRPALVVTGEFRPVVQHVASVRRGAGREDGQRRQPPPSTASGPNVAWSSAAATRAAPARGVAARQAERQQVRDASKPWRRPAGTRRPRSCRRAVAGAVPDDAQRGSLTPCSAMHATRCAWWCCTAMAGTPGDAPPPAPTPSTRSRGAGRGRWRRAHVVQPQEIGGDALERALRLVQRVEVADVLADEDLAATRQCRCVFFMCGPRQDRRQRLGHADGQRRVAARPTQQARRPVDRSRRPRCRRRGARWAGRGRGTGRRCRPADDGLAFVDADRLLRQVAARRDDRPAEPRAAGGAAAWRQHDAEAGSPVRSRPTAAATPPAGGQQHDGRFRRLQQRGGSGIDR
jgi:hypothetical protein